MKALAQQLGANITQLDEYIASGAFNSEFENDKNMAIANGVQGTPSFIIGNILVDKPIAYSEFKKIIDDQLTK